jgi:uncharacterized phage protein gp47/JayE
MSFDIPTLPGLVQRASNDLAQRADSVLRRSDSRVLARVHSGAAYGLYGLIGHVARQILPDTCDEDMLGRWASLKSVGRTPEKHAVGAVLVKGSLAVIVEAGTRWQAAGGLQYRVTVDTPLTEMETPVPVQAVLPGQGGNLGAGTVLSAVSPVLGMVDQAVVGGSGIGDGTDIEPLESWRIRVCRAFEIIPHGGAVDDYETWAREVPGVTRAWCVRTYLGPGTVGLFFVRDNDSDIVPSPAEIDTVQSHIEAQRPVTADLYVLAPQVLAVDYEIRLSPDTDALRGRVEQALRQLHASEGDLGVPLLLSHMREAISTTPGERDHLLIAPADDVVPGVNELPVFGSITWV